MLDVFEQQHQMQWVGGRWNKAKAGVECRGLGILRMDQYGANSDCVGGVEASDQGVFKQALADSFSLLSMIRRRFLGLCATRRGRPCALDGL